MKIFFKTVDEFKPTTENNFRLVKSDSSFINEKNEHKKFKTRDFCGINYSQIGHITESCTALERIRSLVCYAFFSVRDRFCSSQSERKKDTYYEKRWNEWESASKITSVYIQTVAITNTAATMKSHLNKSDDELLKIARTEIDQKNNGCRTTLQKLEREELLKIKERFENAMKIPAWHLEVVKNDPIVQEILTVTTALKIEASRLASKTLTRMLIGEDPDNMMKDLIELVGWGIPSVDALGQNFINAIEILDKKKTQMEPIDQQFKILAGYAYQLLTHRPHIKGLRDQSRGISFLKNVLQPLITLAQKIQLDQIEKDLMDAYNEPSTSPKNTIVPTYKQGRDQFAAQMKIVAEGKLPLDLENSLISKMTSDLRSHLTDIRSRVEPGEFDKQGWLKGKHHSKDPSTNLTQLPIFTNDLCNGIVDIVLMAGDNKQMVARKLEFIGNLAEMLLNDNNFEALIPVMGALNSTALNRLWDNDPGLVPKRNEFHKKMLRINKLISRTKNYANLRNKQNDAQKRYEQKEITNPPITFTGMTFTDLTYIDEKQSNFHSLIKVNLGKCKELKIAMDSYKKENIQLKEKGVNQERDTGFLALIMHTSVNDNSKREDEAYVKSLLILPLSDN